MFDDAARARVIKEANRWLGTPFHDNSEVLGAGVDCAHLLHAVYVGARVVPDFEVEQYSPQFMLHTKEPLFESYVRRFADETDAPQRGDVVLFHIGRSFAHGGIVVDWPKAIIHAFKPYRRVAVTHARDGELRGRQVKFFTPR